MGIIEKVFQYFGSSSIPVGGKVFKMHTTEFDDKISYDYDSIEKLMEDERVQSIVALIASMCYRAYVGPAILPENEFDDQKLDKKEKEALKEASKFLRSSNINAKQRFFDWGWQLASHGDEFVKLKIGESGIEGFVSQPLNVVRVLENQEQRNKRGQGAQIKEENMISVKRHDNDTMPPIIKKDNYIHLSYKNYGVWRKDIEGTETYGVYSKSPIATLIRLTNWKKKTIENDIIWKNKILPRIAHYLKMDSIIPSKYTGTQQEKINKAIKDADAVTSNFINKTKNLKPDDDFVFSDSVDSKVLEANSANYQRPNETISQINGLMNAPHAIPNGLLGGESGASMGIEMQAIFANIRVEYIVGNIVEAFNNITRRHLIRTRPQLGEDVINRIFIHVDPSLTIEKFQKVKIALSMATIGSFTLGEIRRAAGHVSLPQLDNGKMVRIDSELVRWTEKEMTSDINKQGLNSEQNNRSPEAQRNSTGSQRAPGDSNNNDSDNV